ncbi:MAG: undecaprenyldiphospho-muramoylpentapeptide beta-N-acetylglucosaminyltransferase [Candidatus Pacebacteria bacterium]|nr:undecaprenyldiphospho-muramoylpentapeptide beta-N-acetylglucosaminyltransferase [Candidatus Paceibacterota bacterium]
MKKILFTGGGTGGHVFPIIAIAQEANKKGLDLNLSYIGPKDFCSSAFMGKEKIKTYYISCGKIRRYLSFSSVMFNFIDLFFKIPFGIFQAFSIMFFTMPDVIVSKGGFGSIPVVIAGWILRIPIFLHESDIDPGLANKICSVFSEKIFVSFPIDKTEYFPKGKMIETGNPFRKNLTEGNKEEAKKIFKLISDKPLILVFGGSQGSERINEVILETLPELLKEFEVIHQTGISDFKKVMRESAAFITDDFKKYYHPTFFLDENELKHAYAVADCVISRAGAGSIFELAALKKPSILIPLPESAQNHQVKNAYAYADSGACIVLEESNFTYHLFLEKIKDVINVHAETMKKSAEAFSKPDAADAISKYILDYLS